MAKEKFSFEVDETSDIPIWVQLKQRLIYLITSGYFSPGEKLPTVRGLAADISINYNTVNKAYLSLVDDGYVRSKRGSGVYVRDIDAGMNEEFIQEVDTMIEDLITACRDLGLSFDDIETRVIRKIKSLQVKQGIENGEPGYLNILDIDDYNSKKQVGNSK